MDKRARNKEIAYKWFEAFNEHDLEKLLALYDNDARHFSPKLKIRKPDSGGWIEGKDALRSWWQDAFERLPTLQYQLDRLTIDEHQIFMEYTRKVMGEEDMLVAEVLEINDMIVVSRVYHG